MITFKNRDPETWYMWELSLLTTGAQKQVGRIGRRYADGLIKFEPGSVGKIQLPKMKDNSDYKGLYDIAIKHVLSSNMPSGMKIADSYSLKT